MANSVQILDKIARDMDMLAIAYTRASDGSITINNGANDLTFSYVSASIQAPMGGIDPATSPFLGIGVGAPGQIKVKFQAATVAACLDTSLAIRSFCVALGRGNDVILEDSAGTPNQVLIRGHVDMIGVGA